MKRVAFVLCALLGLGLLRLLWWQYGPLPAGAPGDAARGEWAFLHSDLGSKWYGSMPRAVYEAMPKLVPDVLVEGWEGSAGLLPDPQDPQGPPVGMVRARMLGSEWYAPNCAMCHAGRSAALGDRIIPGAPNADLDVQRLVFAIDQAIRRGKGVADVERATHPLSITERLAAFLYLRIAGAKLAARSCSTCSSKRT